jgi:hypothetical protein
MGFSIKISSKKELFAQICILLDSIILHHFCRTYNYFFNFSVTTKKTSGKTKK